MVKSRTGESSAEVTETTTTTLVREPSSHLILLTSVQEQVFRKTRTIQQIANITYEEFTLAVQDLNEISSHFLDENGKQLIFAVKKGTDSTLFWKATVKVACVKVDSASKNIDSYRPLNLSSSYK